MLKAEKTMNKILVCGCAESRCFVTVSKSVKLESSTLRLALYANWSGSRLSDSMSDSQSPTALSMHLQSTEVRTTGL